MTSQPSFRLPRRALAALLAPACALALAACSEAAARPASTAVQVTASPLTQWSPFVALQNGVYEAATTVGEVRAHGSIALSAAVRLNGEMLLLDGRYYQFLSDGRTVRAPATLPLSFALAGSLTSPTQLSPPQPVTYPFGPAVDALFPSPNWFYTLRAHGTFACIIVRTFPQQAVDTPIAYVHPRVDTLRGVVGTVAGFREPSFVGLTSVAGYHLHFVADSLVAGRPQDGGRQRGGHVLAFRASGALPLLASRLSGLNLVTPTSAAYQHADLDSVRGPPGAKYACP